MLSRDFRGSTLRGGDPAGGGAAVLLALPSSLVMTVVAWAAFRLTHRHPLARQGLVRAAAVHAGAALGLALLNTGVRKAVRALLAEPGPGYRAARDGGELAAVLVLYAVLALAAHALWYARRYRERRMAELRLQASLARAELDRADAELRTLKLQLNPHFLFNALHAVSALLHDAPDAAERMARRLGDLLRQASGRAGTQEVPLEEEIRTLEPFLEVERIRLGGRLRVEWRIGEEARAAHVPHRVLQPLVENAIKHGLAPRAGGGCVQVAARRDGPWLELCVRDDGVGPAAAAGRNAAGAGIGMANTRARLARLYGDDHALEMAPADGGGTRVTLRLPWHAAPLPPRALGTAEDAAAEAPPRMGWGARAAAAGLFLLLAQYFIGRTYGTPMPVGRTAGRAEAVVCGGLNAALVTLIFSAAFVLARRAPARGRTLGRTMGTGLALTAGLSVERATCSLLWGTPPRILLHPEVIGGMAAALAVGMVAFGAAAAAAYALEYARRARATEAHGLRLQASLARAELSRTSAELRGLRMQVNPAFLFRALEAVAERVRVAPGDAERMVVRLADVLRGAMAGAGAGEVPLEDEVRALEPLLEVERIRLGGRLAVDRDVDGEALDAFVPPLLLQPLVLGATGAMPEGGSIRIAAWRRGAWLEVEVRASPAPDSVEAEHGVAETEARLAQAYGTEWRMETGRTEGGGCCVVLRLPWHEEPWPAPAAGATTRKETAVP